MVTIHPGGPSGTPTHYEAETPGSRLALKRAAARLPGGISRQTLAYPPYPFFAARGEGAHLHDIDGRRYLDLANNYTSLIHGHAHPATVSAVQAAVAASGAPGAPTELELEVASELNARIPSLELLRFAISGSEAVGFALRAARAFTRRARIVKFEGAFHGCFDEVQVSVGGSLLEAGGFGPGVPASAGVSGRETIVCRYNDVASVEAAFAAHGEEIAAIVVEPYLGNGALLRAADGFLGGLRDITRAHGALLVLDEVQSCRIAFGGAQSVHRVLPDLTVVGKTIGGGLPLAAFGGQREVLEPLFSGEPPPIVQTGTFNAFPASLAAARATLVEWGPAEIETLNASAAKLRKALRGVLADRQVIAAVSGEGSMLHVELGVSEVESYADIPADRSPWQRLHVELLALGVHMTNRGSGCLSTAMTSDDLDQFLWAFDTALTRAYR